MRAADEGEAAAPAAAWRLGLALAAVALLVWTLFFGGDSQDPTWLGTYALAIATVAVAGALLAQVPWPSLEPAGLAL
ncbi:MAG TPA: hypothetical protein VF063_01495, partial [Gaiellaceae bacterium]